MRLRIYSIIVFKSQYKQIYQLAKISLRKLPSLKLSSKNGIVYKPLV